MKPIRILSVAACLLAVTSVAAQNLITEATDAVWFSKRDFADTIKIKVMDGAVVVPVEIEGRTRNLLFDTGSPLGLWVGQKEDWMRRMTADSLTLGDINGELRKQTIYQIPTMRLGSLQIENYPTIVESAVGMVACNKFDGVLGFNLVGKGLSFKLDTKDITVGNSEAGSVTFIPTEAGDTLGVLKAVVRKGSAAYQKGVRTGNYLIEVNDTPITDVCTYMLIERLRVGASAGMRYDEEAQFKFRNPDGTEKSVRLKRTH